MSTRPRTLAIVNPASSNGRTLGRWARIEGALREAFSNLEVARTEGPGHATLLCREALERGTDLVLSIGGDGTNNEVLCGFVDDDGNNRFPQGELGLIASGTGGDFHRHLGRCSVEKQLDVLREAPSQPVDYGVVQFVDHQGHAAVRPFLNIASAGVSGLIDYYVGRSNKLLGPTATYLLGSLLGIFDYHERMVTMVIDEGASRTMPLTLAVMANGQYFGGGMWIAPEAVCDDGWLDVIHTGGRSKLQLLGLLAKVFRGTHIHSPAVHTRRAHRVRIVPKNDQDVILLDLDGEQPGRLPAEFRIVHRGLRLRAAGLATRPRPSQSSGRFEPEPRRPGYAEPSDSGPLIH